MKKKIMALSLVVAMVVMNNVVALGATVTSSDNGSTWSDSTNLQQDVNVVFSNTETPVYSVDITWGSMNFTYVPGTWQDSHKYTGSKWQITSAADNDITVSNHSNKDVYVKIGADFTGSNNSTGQTIKGEFEEISSPGVETPIDIVCSGSEEITTSTIEKKLDKGVLNKRNEAKKEEKELKISGDIGNDLIGSTKAGKITITLKSSPTT